MKVYFEKNLEHNLQNDLSAIFKNVVQNGKVFLKVHINLLF